VPPFLLQQTLGPAEALPKLEKAVTVVSNGSKKKERSMQRALILDGKVVDVILADDAYVAQIAHKWDRIVTTTTAGIGWLDDGVNLTPPPLPVQTRREAILSRLQEIDFTTDRPRARREMALDKAGTKAWLQTLDNEAAALRAELAGL
jgi:hypothetical protein